MICMEAGIALGTTGNAPGHDTIHNMHIDAAPICIVDNQCANMHIDSKDLVPVSIWEVRTPHMYMGSSRKHMGGVDTPYAYGSSRKHMGAVSIWGFTYIPIGQVPY